MACIARDTGRSPLPNAIRGGARLSCTTTPAWRCSTMFEPSQPNLFGDDWDTCPTSSSEVRPARTPALPVGTPVQASTASAQVCFGKLCGSCENCDPIGHALKMWLGSQAQDMTGWSAQWSETATPSGPSIWALRTSGRQQNADAYGCLPWPTVTKRDWKTPGVSRARRGRIGSAPLSEVCKLRGILGGRAKAMLSEWLQGFPAMWLADALSPPTATPSSRKSPKRSGA